MRSFDLDVGLYGMAPSCYWNDVPGRLLVVPEALLPLEDAAAAAAGHEKVLVVDPETALGDWRALSDLDLDGIRSVQWSLERQVVVKDHSAFLLSATQGRGPVAELSFSGVRFPLPVYNPNFPPFGEKGWGLETRRVGWARLAVRNSASEPASVELTKTLINTSVFPDLHSLATWLPGGRFLVLSPRADGERRLLLLGPFQGSSAAAPIENEKDRES